MSAHGHRDFEAGCVRCDLIRAAAEGADLHLVMLRHAVGRIEALCRSDLLADKAVDMAESETRSERE